MTSRELNALLDSLEEDPNGNGPFVGRLACDAVRRARYPFAWRPLVERYIQLVGEDRSAANLRVYLDMACTVITKKIMMVDLFYMNGSETAADAADEPLRRAHMETATMYLAKMAACVFECVYERSPDDEKEMAYAASLLYAEVYAEAFEVETVQEREVFRVARDWLCEHVLRRPEGRELRSVQNVATGVPFLLCSHVYWLWLHLTAARVRAGTRDLLTIVYGLDTIVYCASCAAHFLQRRDEFFTERGGGELAGRADNAAELLFHLHNGVNVRTGSSETDIAVLLEYEEFWKRR